MPQDNSKKMNPDETAATLAFATHLSQQTMPKAPPQAPQGATGDQNEQDESNIQDEIKANSKEMEKMMDTKLNDFKKEIMGTIKDEIGGIKDIIQEALKEDDGK